jgi:hypothetical protein
VREQINALKPLSEKAACAFEVKEVSFAGSVYWSVGTDNAVGAQATRHPWLYRKLRCPARRLMIHHSIIADWTTFSSLSSPQSPQFWKILPNLR